MNVIPFNYRCSSCGLRGKTQDGQDACGLHKRLINPNSDGCTWHQNSTGTCALCGGAILDNPLIQFLDDQVIPLCQNCSSVFYSCATCINAQICGFKNDHSEPQIVTQRVQNGYMVMQQQVKNPTLVERHCSTCYCSYGETNICLKDSQGVSCPNWQFQITLLR